MSCSRSCSANWKVSAKTISAIELPPFAALRNGALLRLRFRSQGLFILDSFFMTPSGMSESRFRSTASRVVWRLPMPTTTGTAFSS